MTIDRIQSGPNFNGRLFISRKTNPRYISIIKNTKSEIDQLLLNKNYNINMETDGSMLKVKASSIGKSRINQIAIYKKMILNPDAIIKQAKKVMRIYENCNL